MSKDMGKAGSKSGAVEHRYSGKSRIELSAESREMAQLLLQEAQVRRDFGEEGVRLFWQKVEQQALAETAEVNETDNPNNSSGRSSLSPKPQ